MKEFLRRMKRKAQRRHYDYVFEADGMRLWDKNLASLNDSKFTSAYADSVPSRVHIQFRAYVCCWAANHASKLPGDFVECGVNEGWLSSTVCAFIDFNSLDKKFYLYDTYEGIPEEQISEREKERSALHKYIDCYERTKGTFAKYPRVELIRGKVPDTLPLAPIERLSYLSIDMNIAAPELAAIEYFWPKISPGGVVILDDYAFGGYDAQHETMNQFAASIGHSILTMPTGQGLMFKH